MNSVHVVLYGGLPKPRVLRMLTTRPHDRQLYISVEKWDGAAVRNALDDEIRQILTKDYKYEENFVLPDGRLLISLLAVGAAGWALLWDWWYPFPASRPILILCVAFYFLLMGLLTAYTKFIEKGVFVVAKKKVRVVSYLAFERLRRKLMPNLPQVRQHLRELLLMIQFPLRPAG